MMDLFDLRGKVAWITGASLGGLGFYHALCLGQAGADLVVSDLSSRASDLGETKRKLENMKVKAVSIYTDVSKEEDVRDAVTKIEEEFGRLHILVNNAGVTASAPALEMPLEDWNRVLSVNLTGVWLCSRTACRLMVKTKTKGEIVNIASTYGRQAAPEPAAPYYASKAAVINLTRALAVEWGQYGINVNAVAPGWMRTRMAGFVDENPDVKRRMLERTVFKRAGDPTKDLAGALLFLASSASDWVTGQTIFVDGGYTAT